MQMIDTSARRRAQEIAVGNMVGPILDAKIEFYGRIARLLDGETFETLDVRSADSFGSLMVTLNLGLTDRVLERFYSLPLAERLSLDVCAQASNNRNGRPFGNDVEPASERLIAGTRTAVAFEALTLCTIAKKQTLGETISMDGLHASRRVPFAYALTHMLDTKLFVGDTERWDDSEGHYNKVLRDELATMSHAHGLVLTRKPRRHQDDNERQRLGPQIGCPATLIKGVLAAVHTVAAEAAVAGELIQVS